MPPVDAANVLAYVLQVSLIAAATTVCMALVRVRAPLVRYCAWRALLWLAVILPLVQPWDVTTTIVTSQAVEAAGWSAAGTGSRPATAPAQPLGSPLVLVLLTGMAVRLLWLLAGAVRLRRIARRAGSDLSDAADLQQTMQTQADIRYSADLAQPATCGVLRPIVLLPLTLRALNGSIRRAVLAHELVHVKRRDWAALMVEELLRAALWFNPAVWWLVDRVHASREEVVDAEAVQYANGRRNYVRALLAFAEAPVVAAVPAFAHRRHLFGRIQRLCEESTMSPARLVVASCLLLGTVGTTGVYAVNAFPLLAGEGILLAPSAPSAPAADPLVSPKGLSGRTQDVPPSPPPAVPPAHILQSDEVPPPPPPPAPPAVQDPPLPPPAVRMRQTPAVIRDVRPSYPVEAMRAGIEGGVEVEVTIGEEGTVTHARVVRSANPALDDAALDAARQWVFAKPTEGPVVRTIELTFTLRRYRRDMPPPPPAAPPAVEVTDDGEPWVRVGGNIRAPAKIRHVAPVYPPIARSANVSGVVILEARIGRDGRVLDARVLRSIPLLDQAAIDAVTQWEFRPTLLNGVAVPVIMTVTVNFVAEQL